MHESCCIRSLTRADLAVVLAWRNHPDVCRYMLTQHRIGLDEHVQWFEQKSQDASCQLLIVEEGAIPIGYVQFNNISPEGICDWGFYTNPALPPGAGKKLGRVALNHAFNEMRWHKVHAKVISFNQKSIAFHLRLGFKQEGVLGEHVGLQGAYRSLICFGLLRSDWQSNVPCEEMRYVDH